MGGTWAIRGQNPDAILYDPATHQVFIFNGRSKDVTVLDAASSAIKGTIPVAGKPEFAATVKTGSGTDGVAYDPGTGCAYASNGEGTITVIRREGPDRYTTATIPTRRGRRRGAARHGARQLPDPRGRHAALIRRRPGIPGSLPGHSTSQTSKAFSTCIHEWAYPLVPGRSPRPLRRFP